MKTKLRNIVVNNHSFVYWYYSSKSFILNFSPKNDKNIKIQLIFEASPPDNDPYMFWAFYKIFAIKNRIGVIINIAQPQFVADVISYLLSNQKEIFMKGKPHIINAMELLREMGYVKLKPMWIKEW